jgi:hypothetical protein
MSSRLTKYKLFCADVARYVKSRKGAHQLVHNGYIYTRDRICKDTDFWRCCENNKLKCHGRCKTIHGLVTVTAGHNHLPQDEKIRIKAFLAEVKERLAKGEEDADEIFASIPSDISEACELSSLKQSFMRCYRQAKARETVAQKQEFHF